MKVAVVLGHAVPNPTAGGATLTNWTIVQYLLERGHEVAVFPLLGAEYVDPTDATLQQRVDALETLGATVTPLRSQAGSERSGLSTSPGARLRRWANPPDELLYPTLADRDAVQRALEAATPDVVFAYHWDALAALEGVHVAPKLGVAVDLSHLPHLYRWRAGFRRDPARSLRALPILQGLVRRQPRLMARFLRDCEAAGDFAAHHAAWLRKHGAPHCEYLRTPVPDPLGEDWHAARGRAAGDKPRLLLMGHLRGIATLEGLELALEGVLPILERELGADGFEVRLVGGYDPPPALRSLLDRPSITLSGHTEDPGAAFLSAQAMLVPTPIKLGTRVRIISAFSYGTPVVAHEANALGIPELVHGDNAWLGRSAEHLAAGVLAAFRDTELRTRLSERGRATFERHFAPPVAVGRIEEILTRIAG
jgi:glycosyltransferase involved in cell wall biosynthesis